MFASARVNHHPIRRNERKPTPSQPIRSWNRLLAEISRIMAMRNIVRSREKVDICGSDDM